MEVEHLCSMANQIGRYYRAVPDRAEGMLSTATHMRRFWDPRMRRALYDHLDRTGGAELDPMVHEAVITHRVLLEPPRQEEQQVSAG